MEENPARRLDHNLSKAILYAVDYEVCSEFDRGLVNSIVRPLGDFKFPHSVRNRCRVPNKGILTLFGPKPRHWWEEDKNKLYVTNTLQRAIDAFRVKREKYFKKTAKKKRKRTKQDSEDVYTASQQFIMSSEFCQLLQDPKFFEHVRGVEVLQNILCRMWRPARPVDSLRRYVVAKHASIHYILSTHAILPSADCFSPSDIQKLMHVPMKWIGSLPRQEDTRCITKFIAWFADLFVRKAGQHRSKNEDPLERHARKCGQRIFLDIIRYANDGTIRKPVKRPHRALSPDVLALGNPDYAPEDLLELPPLDWDGQLRRYNVRIVRMPRVPPAPVLTVSRFRRAITVEPTVGQAILPRDNPDLMRLRNTSKLTEADNDKHHTCGRLLLNRRTRALKRAVQHHVICPKQRVFTGDGRPNYLESIADDERRYLKIASYLPHNRYTFDQLAAIRDIRLREPDPVKSDTSWLKDAAINVDIAKPHQWDPNRRVYEANVKSPFLPPLNAELKKARKKQLGKVTSLPNIATQSTSTPGKKPLVVEFSTQADETQSNSDLRVRATPAPRTIVQKFSSLDELEPHPSRLFDAAL